MKQQSLQISKMPNSSKNAKKAFYTDVGERSQLEEQGNKIAKFVGQIEKKIEYAQWKQDLILRYNYAPLKRITQKLQNEKLNYLNKINREEKLSANILSGKQITVQLDIFREFSKKLNQKIHQIQLGIAEEKMKNQMLSKEAEQKRRRLKEKIRDNVQTIKQILDQQGVKNKQDIVSVIRSKSTKDKFNPTSITFRTQNCRKISARKLSSETSKRQNIVSRNIKLFQECLNQLIASIQSMKSSEDIQSGIYLDIMQKTQKNSYKTENRSTKSKIFQTLHAKFGNSHIKHLKNSQNKTNFQMDWQTFKQLNWKQIMGILLVKDKNCQKIKKLLRYK